jgi:sortase A
MVDTAEQTAPDPAPAARTTTWGDRVRFVLRGLGQTMITLGVVVLLFVVYEVYVTNYFAERDQQHVVSVLENEWANDNPAVDPLGDGRLPLPGQQGPKLPDGQGIAFLYIPRLGNDYSYAIVQGTNDADLEKGPGHYPSTALPGQKGNFGIAGHRVGKGEPFLNLDQLRAGDPVIVQTKTHWYVYTILGENGDLGAKNSQGVPGREIVSPSDGNVLLPVPDNSSAPVKFSYITLTTCHPKFTAQNRMILHGVLAKTVKADGLAMPAAVKAFYTS